MGDRLQGRSRTTFTRMSAHFVWEFCVLSRENRYAMPMTVNGWARQGKFGPLRRRFKTSFTDRLGQWLSHV